MSKTAMWVVGIIAVLAIGIGAVVVFGGNDETPEPATTTASTADRQDGSGQAENENTNNVPQTSGRVAIQNMAFTPATITVKRGGTITWINSDSVAHQIVGDDSNPVNFTGPTMQNGQTYSFTFNETGTFEYHCGLHPEMKGKVVVTD